MSSRGSIGWKRATRTSLLFRVDMKSITQADKRFKTCVSNFEKKLLPPDCRITAQPPLPLDNVPHSHHILPHIAAREDSAEPHDYRTTTTHLPPDYRIDNAQLESNYRARAAVQPPTPARLPRNYRIQSSASSLRSLTVRTLLGYSPQEYMHLKAVYTPETSSKTKKSAEVDYRTTAARVPHHCRTVRLRHLQRQFILAQNILCISQFSRLQSFKFMNSESWWRSTRGPAGSMGPKTTYNEQKWRSAQEPSGSQAAND
ncbi:hypothetical protein C8F01DRAFT_1083485 [Mycena amicta]|nr:hypothetical protein C8F01DRAFT_1083485 [Mycena amicta]